HVEHESRRSSLPMCRFTLCRMFPGFGNDAAFIQTIDFGYAESEVPENFVVVLSNVRGPPSGDLRDAMHLHRTADCGRQLAACTFERNDDVVRTELGIVDYLLRTTHCSERHVNAVEHRVPMRHRLGTKDPLEDLGELRHICRQLRRIGESRISQEIGAANHLCDGREL